MVRWSALYAGLLALFAFSAMSQEQSAKWFEVPQDESALVVIAETKQPGVLFTADAEQKQLDKFSWDFGWPLVRQFRLEPGAYQIVVNGEQAKPLDIKLRAGELSYLQVPAERTASPKVFPATYEPLKRDVGAIIEELSLKGYDNLVAPLHLDPSGHTLYFNTEPPFTIPRPGDPPPPKQ